LIQAPVQARVQALGEASGRSFERFRWRTRVLERKQCGPEYRRRIHEHRARRWSQLGQATLDAGKKSFVARAKHSPAQHDRHGAGEFQSKHTRCGHACHLAGLTVDDCGRDAIPFSREGEDQGYQGAEPAAVEPAEVQRLGHIVEAPNAEVQRDRTLQLGVFASQVGTPHRVPKGGLTDRIPTAPIAGNRSESEKARRSTV
jgi:hypothetical protein